jgi:Domain of unknown function (DUF4118)
MTDMCPVQPVAAFVGHEASPSEPTRGRAKATDGAEIGDMLIVRPFASRVDGFRVLGPDPQTTTIPTSGSRGFREIVGPPGAPDPGREEAVMVRSSTVKKPPTPLHTATMRRMPVDMNADTEPIDHVGTPDERAARGNSKFSPSLMFGLGPMAAFFVAALLVVARDDIGTTNVALLIALVVVVAATADRAAGVATALVASLAYNFFHTEPYRSLRISDGQDILTVVLLIVIGLVVSEISARARQAISGRKRLGDAERSLERTAELLASGAGVSEIWESIRRDIIRLMHVADCRFEDASGSGSISELPFISRAGTLDAQRRVWVDTGFELPESGAAIRVVYRGDELGQIALIPRAGAGSLTDERRLAVALADQFAVSLVLARRSG